MKIRKKGVILKAWLARSRIMGYEIFGGKPELVSKGEACSMWKDVSFDTDAPGVYFRLPNDAIHADSTLFLKHLKKRKINLRVEITGRRGT